MERSNAPVVLVLAGPGSGKSSFLSTWHDTHPPCAWLSLERQDEDPRNFLAALCESLAQVAPGLAARAKNNLKLLSSPSTDWPLVVRELTLSLSRSPYPDFSLILDDFHLTFRNPKILEITGALLAGLPPGVRVLIGARRIPEFAGENGRTLILDDKLLAFTVPEIQDLFKQVFRVRLTEGTARVLYDKTEGWIMGITFFSHLTGREALPDQKDGYARSELKTPQGVFRYLAQETYRHLPQSLQVFLKYSAVFRRFRAKECALWFSTEEVQASLEEIGKQNLFLCVLDADQGWHRYHHLFSEFLNRKLLEENGDKVFRDLHCEAGRFCHSQREWEEAIHHYQEAGDHDGVRRILLERGEKLLWESHSQTVRRWLSFLPDVVRKSSDSLSLLEGKSYEMEGDFRQALPVYERCGRVARKNQNFENVAAAHNALAFGYWAIGDLSVANRHAEKAVSSCPLVRKDLFAVCMADRGVILVESGRHMAKAYEFLRQALVASRDVQKNDGIAWVNTLAGAYLHLWQGNFAEARRCFEEAAGIYAAAGDLRMVSGNRVGIAAAALFSGDLEKALAGSEEALRSSRDLIFWAGEKTGLLVKAMSLLCLSRVDEALRIVREEIQGSIVACCRIWLQSMEVLGLARQGKMDEAWHGVSKIEDPLRSKGPFGVLGWWTTGYVHMLKGNLQEARLSFLKAKRISRKCRSIPWENYSDLTLSALAHFAEKNVTGWDCFARAARRILAEGQEAMLRFDPLGLVPPLFAKALRENRFTEEVQKIGKIMIPSGGRDADLQARLSDMCDPGDPLGRKLLAPSKDGHTHRVQPMPLRIYALGTFHAVLRGRKITGRNWGRKKAEELLKWLVTMRSRKAARTKIVEALWPQRSEKGRWQRLNTAVWRLRHVLKNKEEFIVREGDHYFLNLATCWMDCDELERLLNEAEKLMASGKEQEAFPLLEEARQLYQGPFLPDNTYDAWTRTERKRLEAIYSRVLLHLASLYSNVNLFLTLICCEEGLALDPTHEGFNRFFLSALTRTGQVGRARTHVDWLEEKYEKDLKIPVPAVFEEILAGKHEVTE